MSAENIKEVVKEKYGQAALRVIQGRSSCCGTAPAVDGSPDPITSNLYDGSQTSQIPARSVSRAQARGAIRRLRHCDVRGSSRRDWAEYGVMGRLHGRGAGGERVPCETHPGRI